MLKSNTLKLVVFALVAGSSVAVAATTGTVTLGGTVTSTLTVTSVATSAASTLDLTPGEKIVKVSDIAMSTNNEQGLTLSATSGNLTKTGGTTITFQVTSVPDGDAAPDTGDFAIATGSPYEVGTVVAGGDAVDLYIKYTPASLQDPGAYSGSIGLTVSDN
jgi:hypothetical protein